MIDRLANTGKVRQIFGEWQETIIWSCLQGIMGEIYADDRKKPHSAAAVLGDFVFFAGEPKREFVINLSKACRKDFVIMVPENDGWGGMIESSFGRKAKKVSRYAIKKEPQIFDEENLKRIIRTLPDGYELRMMDEESYNQCRSQEWSRDLVAQYKDYGTYKKLGLGAVILEKGRVVSGASSYSTYGEGIEVEIDTYGPYRRKGLACVCGARLILECCRRNLYPSWDAQNRWSVSLAEKLGYHYSHEYIAYEVWKKETN